MENRQKIHEESPAFVPKKSTNLACFFRRFSKTGGKMDEIG
ncbi:hypothetical protein [Allofournierella massiliensis]